MAYGKIINDLKINNKPAPYPVINEREVRASSGLMFVIGISAFFTVLFTKNFDFLYILVPIFWLDFFTRTVFQPHYSLFNWIGSLLVKKQKPEYVGVIQKRFAWGIGLILATIMLIGPVIFGIRGILPITICSICLFFMWMESSLGICMGCKMYNLLIKKKIIKEPKYKPVCPGGVCDIK